MSGVSDKESAYKLFVGAKEILGSGLVNVWKFAPSIQWVIDEAENAQSNNLEKQACNDAKSTIRLGFHVCTAW